MSNMDSQFAAQAVTQGPRHHFFGYYDKFPWDSSGRYMLALETSFMDRPPGPEDRATIGIIDLTAGNKFEPLCETRAWNWQQGTMLHWLPTGPDHLFIHNDRTEDGFVSVIRDIHTGKTRTLPRPVYAVSKDGKSAVSPNFSRVHDMRPGYGYVGLTDPGEDELAPEEDGIYWMDLETGENRLIISLAQVVAFQPDAGFQNAKHWFNHLLFNADDTRFIFLHRWAQLGEGGIRATRLYTANPDGTDICLLEDSGLVSHFDWRGSTHVLAFSGHNDERHFHLYQDQSTEVEVVGAEVMDRDGHCSYSPDQRWILNDTYPDEEQKRGLFLYRVKDSHRVDIGRFFSPPELQGEIRCDLHPRWSRDGTQACFDSVHEGSRQMYVVDVSEIVGGR